jgi:hypothetical protein
VKVEAQQSRDRRIVKRFKLNATPQGLALASDGMLYAGLADRQSVAAIKANDGSLQREVVLDDADIAATKELVSLRLTADEKRLIVANGSDESVTILSLPDLAVVREIGLEGETIRDAVPDPAGRYLYVLGRVVHVFDFDGQEEIRTLDVDDPMTVSVNRSGSVLAVTFAEKFPSGAASSVALFDVSTFKEVAREPLQTDRAVRAAAFGADGNALVFVADDWLAEKELVVRKGKATPKLPEGEMRISLDDALISSTRICLATNPGPQIVALSGDTLSAIVPEKRCSRSGAFTNQPRMVTPLSLYNVAAFALAFDSERKGVWATDPAGYLTMYRVPAPAAPSSRP